MARIAAQPLEIVQLRLAALRERHDVVALAILRHPPAGLAGVLVPALDCLYQPAPWPAASAFAPPAHPRLMIAPLPDMAVPVGSPSGSEASISRSRALLVESSSVRRSMVRAIRISASTAAADSAGVMDDPSCL